MLFLRASPPKHGQPTTPSTVNFPHHAPRLFSPLSLLLASTRTRSSLPACRQPQCTALPKGLYVWPHSCRLLAHACIRPGVHALVECIFGWHELRGQDEVSCFRPYDPSHDTAASLHPPSAARLSAPSLRLSQGLWRAVHDLQLGRFLHGRGVLLRLAWLCRGATAAHKLRY